MPYLSIEDVSRVALPVIHVVRGEVFAAGRRFEPGKTASSECVALQSPHIGDRIPAGGHRVLAGSLLASAPSGVSENVDVR